MPGPGQDDANGVLAKVRSQAVEELVDRRRLARDIGRQMPQAQSAATQRPDMTWRDHIDAVRLDEVSVFSFRHWHSGPPGDDFRQHAFAVGGHVQRDDESHAAIGRHGLEEPPERLDASG